MLLPEIICEISTYLTYYEVIILSFVCKKFYVILHPKITKMLINDSILLRLREKPRLFLVDDINKFLESALEDFPVFTSYCFPTKTRTYSRFAIGYKTEFTDFYDKIKKLITKCSFINTLNHGDLMYFKSDFNLDYTITVVDKIGYTEPKLILLLDAINSTVYLKGYYYHRFKNCNTLHNLEMAPKYRDYYKCWI